MKESATQTTQATEAQVSTGVKETKEFLNGLFALGVLLAKNKKSGVMGETKALVEALIADSEFKQKLGDAIDGIKLVPAEVKDLNLVEGFELVQFAIPKVQELVSALKE